MSNNWLFLFLLSILFYKGASLVCVQCDMHSQWYSEEEQERQIEACQRGIIEPTHCTNRSHTHCIVSWYRNGINSERTVTERKCGGVDDVTGCTLYNSKINRKVRHLLNKDTSSSGHEVRTESVSSFIEVCSESCPYGDCSSSSSLAFVLALLVAVGVNL